MTQWDASKAQAGGGEELPWADLHEVLLGDDAGFADKKEAMMGACRMGEQESSEEMVRAVALVFQSLSPEYMPDEELQQRPRHLDCAQELLRRGAVNKIIFGLSGPFRHIQTTQSTPSVLILHTAAALVGITQRFQLTPPELSSLLDALHVSLQVLDGWMDQSLNGVSSGWAQGASAGGSSTLAGTPATPHLRFQSGSPGALLEDVAYLLSLSVVNALRVPQEGGYAMWSRDAPKPSLSNSLLDSAEAVGLLTRLSCRSPDDSQSASTYVQNKIEQIGRGDRRSREEAAGYYAIALIGVSAFLMSHPEQDTRDVGAMALQMCCGSLVSLAVNSRVLARYKWKGSVFAWGTVRSVRADGTVVVRFEDGDEEAVPRTSVKLESKHQLSGHGWLRAREWFPSFFSCGLGTVVTEETVLLCLSNAMDCWLAASMCVLVDELIPAEQEEYRVWEECMRQRDTPAYGAAPATRDALYEDYSSMAATEVPPTPECRILVDVLRAIAYTLNPDASSLLLKDRLPLAWRSEVIRSILAYDKSDASITSPRPGTAMFIRFVRKAHGSQGPLAWVMESSPGRQGDLCPTALSVLSAYLELLTGLCITDDAAAAVFSMMAADKEPRSTFHISARYIITDPECSVMGSLASGSCKLTPEADGFLNSVLQLISAWLMNSPQVREAVGQQPDLRQACFNRLFTLLERPVSGAVVGQVFNTLAAWCDSHESAAQMWLRVHQGGVLTPTQGTQPPNQALGWQGQGGALQQYGGQYAAQQRQPNDMGGAPSPSGMEYELGQERRNRRYPQTIGFLSLVLQLLKTVSWRMAAQQTDVSLHSLAVVYVKWCMESVMSRWDEQRYDDMREKWHIAFLLLRIVRAAILIPEPHGNAGYDQSTARQRTTPSLIWMAITDHALLRKLMAMTSERRERDLHTGVIMDEMLTECLATILTVLKQARGGRRERGQGRGGSDPHGKDVAQELVDWDGGSIVMKLASDEWHSITLRQGNTHLPSQLCLSILLQLVQERCQLSHHFLAPGRGRPEDITRDAEETLLDVAKRAYAEAMKPEAAKEQQAGAALDKYVIRPLEAGSRVTSVVPQLQRHLVPLMARIGMQREAAEVLASLPAFENNRADMVQELMAAVLNMEVDDSDMRRLLVCDILIETLESDSFYYNLTHILCGVPERYVEARTRGTLGLSDHDVLRPYGQQRQTCVSVLAERLLDLTFVKQNPVAASRFLKVLAALASDRVIGSAVLRYIRSVNLVDELMSVLKDRLSELPVQPSAVRDPTIIAREFGMCASILQLAALELFTNPDASAQKHILKVLCTTRESSHPLLLETIRSLDVDSLPEPAPVSEMLVVPVHVVQEGGVPSYALEALEEQLGGVPFAQEAMALAAAANEALAVYPCVVDYVEKWCRLAEVTLVIIEQEAEGGSSRSAAAEGDEVLFQTLLALINQMSINLGRARSMPHTEGVVNALLTKQRAKMDARLSRTAIALVDAIYARSQRCGSHRSAEQLGHLLRPLLQCLCDAADKELRTNIYTVLIAFLHNVDECPRLDRGSDSAMQADADKLQVRRACQDELLRSPQALMQRLMADVTDSAAGIVTTAAWTTMAKLVEWDDQDQVASQLHGTNLIAQQLSAYDEVLCGLLNQASQGDTMGAGTYHLGGYQAYMSFLLAYANTNGGAKALVEQHAFLKHLTGRQVLSMCGDGFPSTLELLQERCAQVALPALRVISTLVQHLASDHTVMQQVDALFQKHSRLFDFILRRPFSLRKVHDSLDLTSLQMLECTVQVLAVYAGSEAQCARLTAPNLVQQYQLRSVLAEFSCRSLWAQRVQSEAAGAPVADWGLRGPANAADEATTTVTGIVFNVLQCLRKVSDMGGAMQPLFQLSVGDPDSISAESVLSRVDLTVLLSCLKDMQRTALHLLKTQPGLAQSAGQDWSSQAELLPVLHHSVAEALLLLLHHVRHIREIPDARFRAQAQQHTEPVLKETSEYVRAFAGASRHDRITLEIMTTIDTIVRALGGALGVSVSNSAYAG
eukprot:TRINITY_DN18282_c2_g2_i1.p1 TRINITY_DN18282_c2_g2~~TRINITY_DN18282_c2_g2_i1.p1  ORF type:complete len:2018 (+),score=816.66 TRINITY_DN18282_c2_g2_i1:138-6191(+)